jgi:hypothetical protein
MGKGEEKMEKELNVRKYKEEYRNNNKKEYTNNCALPSVTTIFIFIV